MNSKVFSRIIIFGTLVILVGFASITIYIDPYFHYHKPLESLEYPINNERYMNNGIVKHFDYDAIITGTSMTQNFKTSECDSIFGCNSIKVSFSGGYYKEIDQNIKRALHANPNIKLVIRGLDSNRLNTEKDEARYEDSYYPQYLYNYNYLDDVNYVLSKEILINNSIGVLEYTKGGHATTTFNEYSNWNNSYTFGKETVLGSYTRAERINEIEELSEEEIVKIKANIYQNIEQTAEENPDTMFYLFFTPYSICYWDDLSQGGKLLYHIETQKIVIEQLLMHDNIKLYSFSNDFDLVCNLDNYKDQAHYGEWVNSQMLERMEAGEYELTNDNYLDYLKEITHFFSSYDYDGLYAED